MRILQTALRLAFLSLLLLGVSTGAWAQTKDADVKWERYDRDENGVRYLYDKRSLSFPETNMLRVRRQRVFPAESSYKSIVTLDEIDCYKQKYRTLEITVTNKDGSVEEFKKVSQWAYIYVGMPEDYFLREHCK